MASHHHHSQQQQPQPYTITVTSNERAPLLGGGVSSGSGPSTLIDPEDMYPHLPKPVSGVPVDPEVLEKLRQENLMWKTTCWISHVLLIFPPIIYLLNNVQGYWWAVPKYLLFGISREMARIFLILCPWAGILVSYLGWRYLKPPADKHLSAELPLTPWQWVELREGKADPKILEAAVWWAEHPASLRQHAEFAVISWLVWSVLCTASAEALLICGFEFAFRHIPSWPWAMIPFTVLGGAHYTSVAMQYFVVKGLKKNPVEDRGIGEGVLVPGLDIRSVLQRERKRFDPCGAFPEPWAYFLGEILIFCLLL